MGKTLGVRMPGPDSAGRFCVELQFHRIPVSRFKVSINVFFFREAINLAHVIPLLCPLLGFFVGIISKFLSKYDRS